MAILDTDPNGNTNPGGFPGPAGGPSVHLVDGGPQGLPGLNARSPETASPSVGTSTALPGNEPASLPSSDSADTEGTHQPSTNSAPVSALPATTPQVDIHDDGFSSDDNTHNNSNTSSTHVTPRTRQTRFQSRKMGRTASPGHAGVETSVLSCELALLNALSSDIEGSVDGLDREQWKTRLAQINQVVRMVQWEAQGLYGLA